jgi:hypothetical protein
MEEKKGGDSKERDEGSEAKGVEKREDIRSCKKFIGNETAIRISA